MIYITTKQSPSYHQVTFEELLFGKDIPGMINDNVSNTRTIKVDKLSPKIEGNTDIYKLLGVIKDYNNKYEYLTEDSMEKFYNTFYTEKKGKGIPFFIKQVFDIQNKYIGDTKKCIGEMAAEIRKITYQHPATSDEEIKSQSFNKACEMLTASGFTITEEQLALIFKSAFRRIDAPDYKLKSALTELKDIFENVFHAMHHTSAFAYVKNRSTKDALLRHRANESRWFGKFDISDFFGSTTIDYIINILSMVYPFSEILRYDDGKNELRKALELCVLRGGLPQGTPISPLITNIIMIPIDHKLSNTLKDYNKQQFIYTRYADDFLISSKYNFDVKVVESLIKDTLKEFGAPFSLNESKTRYGSSSGSNWNLGMMLNKDNNITIGYKKKRVFKAMLASYVMDRENGKQWCRESVHKLEGLRSYYTMVEGETIDRIINHINKKFGVNIRLMIKEDLNNLDIAYCK